MGFGRQGLRGNAQASRVWKGDVVNRACAPTRSVYLRLSVTDRCNLRCLYCRPARGEQDEGCFPYASDAELVGLALLIEQEHPIEKLRLTGGEPLLRPGVVTLVSKLHARLPHTRVSMTTNAMFLAPMARPLRRAGLDRLNISIDSAEPAIFARLTRGGRLDAVIEGIRAARKAGFRGTKINSVLLRECNVEGLAQLVRLAVAQHCEIRFLELMPCGQGASLFSRNFFSAEDALTLLQREFDYLGPAPRSATAERHYLSVGGRKATVGFISSVTHPFCARCNRLRLDCRGRLISCVRSSRAVDLLESYRLQDFEMVRALVRGSLHKKKLPGARWPDRHMVAIGG